MQASDENKEKYQSWDYQWIQYQILQTNIMRIIWQTVKRITNEILGVSKLEWLWKNHFTLMLLFSLWTCGWFTHTGMIFFLLLFFKAIQASFLFLFASLNVCNYGILKNCVSVQMNMMRKLSKCSLWPKRYVFSPYLTGKFHLQCGFWSKWITDVCECLFWLISSSSSSCSVRRWRWLKN